MHFDFVTHTHTANDMITRKNQQRLSRLSRKLRQIDAVEAVEVIDVRYFACITDSSPKTPAGKNSLSKDVLINSPSACLTPTRPIRKNHNSIIDESPTLSQEPINVTWKWGGSDSPVRPLGDTIKPWRSIRHVLGTANTVTTATANSNAYTGQTLRNSFADESSNTALTEVAANDPSNDSPKGLYKFQEELRRLNENATNRDGVSGAGVGCGDISGVEAQLADNSYIEQERSAANLLGNDSFSLSPIALLSDAADENANDATALTEKPTGAADKNLSDSTLTAFKNDLLNDSDFDQVLLTCGDKIEKESQIAVTQVATVSKVEVKVEPKKKEKQFPDNDITITPANNSCLFDNDESIDDIIGNIDDAFIMNSMMTMKQPKFSRHNSMPPKADNVVPMNPRRSFTRHESMPISSMPNRSGHKEAASTATATSSQESNASAQSAISSEYLIANIKQTIGINALINFLTNQPFMCSFQDHHPHRPSRPNVRQKKLLRSDALQWSD